MTSETTRDSHRRAQHDADSLRSQSWPDRALEMSYTAAQGNSQRLVGVVVTAAAYDESGSLELRFADDAAVIRSGPSSEYEAWNFAGANGFLVVCLPDGGVTTWSRADTPSE
jgi:hypothetical protein